MQASFATLSAAALGCASAWDPVVFLAEAAFLLRLLLLSSCCAVPWV